LDNHECSETKEGSEVITFNEMQVYWLIVAYEGEMHMCNLNVAMLARGELNT